MEESFASHTVATERIANKPKKKKPTTLLENIS